MRNRKPKPLFKGPALETFLSLAVRGYTVRRLRELMAERGHSLDKIPDASIVNYLRECLPGLKAQRDVLDADTRDLYGLADKWERVRRLCEAAEILEPKVAQTHQWSGEYRRYLSQIQAELEPLGITFHAGDSWAQLLEKVANVGRPTGGVDTLDEGDASAEGGDDSPAGVDVLPVAAGGP